MHKEITMDNIAEQLVVRKKTSADIIKSIGISVGAILVATILMYLAITLSFFSLVIPAVLVLFGGVWLMGQTNVEYEYIVTNNEMDVDKIIGRRKRKRMITVDLSSATAFAPYPPEDSVSADVTVHASTGLEEDAFCLVTEHGDYGTVYLIFNPNKKIREAIMQELPYKLRINIKTDAK